MKTSERRCVSVNVVALSKYRTRNRTASDRKLNICACSSVDSEARVILDLRRARTKKLMMGDVGIFEENSTGASNCSGSQKKIEYMRL